MWHSPDGINNAVALRANSPEAFQALEEVDRLGHRLIERWGQVKITDMDRLAGTVFLRRAVTVFVGLRHLLEASVVEVGKLPLRALFELYVACRYLLYGTRRRVDYSSRSEHRQREARARYFYVAAERRRYYSQKALLDGRWGHGRIPPDIRARMKKELLGGIADLQERFPTQMKQFGTLRCFKAHGKRSYQDHYDWFSFGFPKTRPRTVYALARRMGLSNEYEMVYAAASGLMHPRGIRHDVKITDEGAEVFHAYMAEAFDFVVFWATSLQMFLLFWLARIYQPDAVLDVQETHKRVVRLKSKLKSGVPDGLF